MTLQSAIEAELPYLRAEAEARMTDTCRITAPGTGSRGPINPTTLKYDTSPAPTVLYEGACRLGAVQVPTVAQAVGGEAAWDTQDFVLHLPVDGTEAVAAGATVEYLTATDAALAGRRFGILGVLSSSQVTARRCRVREVVQD